jgi:hypothetical protein
MIATIIAATQAPKPKNTMTKLGITNSKRINTSPATNQIIIGVFILSPLLNERKKKRDVTRALPLTFF